MKNKLKEFWQYLNPQTSGDIAKQCIDEFHKDLLKCSKCGSQNVTHTIEFNGTTGMTTVSLTCNDCCHAEILQGDKEFEDDRRFVLSDLYMGNDTAPIRDNLLRPEYDKMFYTEIVLEMNYLNNMCKMLWEENRKLRQDLAHECEVSKSLREVAREQDKQIKQMGNENKWLKQSNQNLEWYKIQRDERS